MALSELVRNGMLNGLCRPSAPFEYGTIYVKLHIGDPGTDGSSNPAGETTRQAATFGSNASGGAITNTASVAWTAVSTTEVFSHISLWTASTSGIYLGSAALTNSKTVNSGDNFSIPASDLDLSIA